MSGTVNAEPSVRERFERIVSQEKWQRPIIPVQEMGYESTVQSEAASFIGSVAMNSTTELENSGSNETSRRTDYSLKQAIHEAAAGNQDAYAMVRQNVQTDVIERTIKKGHVMSVELEIDDSGVVRQYGQTDSEIHANSLRFASRHPVMIARIKAETRNKYRTREAYISGQLDDYVLVVFSRVPDTSEMSEDHASEEGFFGDSMSCSIQVTSLCGKNKIQVESAFVAGKKAWNSKRHDAETLAKLGDTINVPFRGKTATEQLDMAVLIRKDLVPNGVIDIVQWWDECAGGTFFGEERQIQDYIAFKKQCAERENDLKDRVDSITEQLISEAPLIKTPRDASMRLNELSAAEMIEQSIEDTSIDPRVFGIEAAYRIEHARYYRQLGRYDLVAPLISQAQLLDQSSSCPGGGRSKILEGIEGTDQDLNISNENSERELKDCEFVSKECPKCHKKNVKTVVKKGRYYGECGCHT